MKKLCLSLTLAIVAILAIAIPALAAYYAYIHIHESAGESYEELPIICSINTTRLIQGDYIDETALDTRVLTGDGYVLPHMVADDKLLFVTDLSAYEDKTLIFYTGQSSLSNFPVIVGHDGYMLTPDAPELEYNYVFELLVSGYFDTSAGSDKNILRKNNAFKVWIPASNTIEVATYNSAGDEQWNLTYNSFTTGEHTVYVVGDGLGALLYVDDFVTAKDTENLFDATYYELSPTKDEYFYYQFNGPRPRTFYAHNMYWAFYTKSGDDTNIFYKTSPDGTSWSSEYSFAVDSGTTLADLSVWLDSNGYMHICYPYFAGYYDYDKIMYRRGYPEANSTITWSADWQEAHIESGGPYPGKYRYRYAMVVTDPSGYPMISWVASYGTTSCNTDHSVIIKKSSTNNGTWTDGGSLLEFKPSHGDCAPTEWLVQAPNSNKAYYLYSTDFFNSPGYVYGRYFNGNSWSGSTDTVFSSSTRLGEYASVCGVADNNDNFYLFYYHSYECKTYLRIRYADGSWGSPIVVATGYSPTVSYNTKENTIYIIFLQSGYIWASVLNIAEGEIHGPYPLASYITGAPDYKGIVANSYASDHFGILYATCSTNSHSTTAHCALWFPWEWNDNNQDWVWMENNVMSYADQITIAVDGNIVLDYQPDSIIQGDTMPDKSTEDNDGVIVWGTNPTGVNATMGMLQSESSTDQSYYYQYYQPGSEDIIRPEPASMTEDMDLSKLEHNPLRPLVQTIASVGGFTERLVWLGLGWIILIACMLFVHLGPDNPNSRLYKNSERPQHFILTTTTGLALAILFYVMGIFPLWPVILLAFGFITSIVYERMPVL